jgi:hypothetical protein
VEDAARSADVVDRLNSGFDQQFPARLAPFDDPAARRVF